MKLDYQLKTPEERVAAVKEIIKETSPKELNQNTLQHMADYVLFTTDKGQTIKERKEEYPIITENRKITINKRQISYEGMVESLENGEDGLQTLISDSKTQLLDNKEPITTEELERYPQLKEQYNIIQNLKQQMQQATGRTKYLIKKQIIEQWQQLYLIKESIKSIPAKRSNPSNNMKFLSHINIDEQITIDPDTKAIIVDSPLSLLKQEHVAILLQYYSQLKQESYEDIRSDMHWLLIDLENAIMYALNNNKTSVRSDILLDLIIWKIDGITNEEIQRRMNAKYGIIHSAQYYSNLWKQRVPKMIAISEQKRWIKWYYNNEKYGEWKQCGECKEWKPVHPLFFSKNSSSKDGYYSKCKDCRNK